MLMGLYEALSQPKLLEDAAINAAVAAAICYVGTHADLDLPPESHYPGLYSMLAHPDGAVRSRVSAAAGADPVRRHHTMQSISATRHQHVLTQRRVDNDEACMSLSAVCHCSASHQPGTS